MKRAIVTVGLGFGDEGKGTAVDYLTRRYEADLVVRYNSGHQAGHNVVLPDGFHHTFSQFGAGTLSGVRTYIGPHAMIEPSAMLNEAVTLYKRGDLLTTELLQLISVHRSALVTTPYHKFLNRIKEIYRIGGKHGSCGVGIGETRKYWIEHGSDSITAGDLSCRSTCLDKLELCRQRLILQAEPYIQNAYENSCYIGALYNQTPQKIFDDWRETIKWIQVVDQTPDFNTAVFEGAQGVLLDEYRGFPPFTTWATTTTRHAREIIDEDWEGVNFTTVGIVRAHASRHGAGPLPTEDSSIDLKDEYNPRNDWQDHFRFGYLDLPMLQYAVCANNGVASLFVTHLDNDFGKVCVAYEEEKFDWNFLPCRKKQAIITSRLANVKPKYEKMSAIEGIKKLGIPISFTSNGKTHEDKQCLIELFE